MFTWLIVTVTVTVDIASMRRIIKMLIAMNNGRQELVVLMLEEWCGGD